jgi:hypothetical protein
LEPFEVPSTLIEHLLLSVHPVLENFMELQSSFPKSVTSVGSLFFKVNFPFVPIGHAALRHSLLEQPQFFAIAIIQLELLPLELLELLATLLLELELPAAVLELEPPEEEDPSELLLEPLESSPELLESSPEGLEPPPKLLELLPEELEPPEPESLEPSELPSGNTKFSQESNTESWLGFIISPLPQAITMAIAANAAKASGIKLVNLDFFDINTSENAYQCEYIIFSQKNDIFGKKMHFFAFFGDFCGVGGLR